MLGKVAGAMSKIGKLVGIGGGGGIPIPGGGGRGIPPVVPAPSKYQFKPWGYAPAAAPVAEGAMMSAGAALAVTAVAASVPLAISAFTTWATKNNWGPFKGTGKVTDWQATGGLHTLKPTLVPTTTAYGDRGGAAVYSSITTQNKALNTGYAGLSVKQAQLQDTIISPKSTAKAVAEAKRMRQKITEEMGQMKRLMGSNIDLGPINGKHTARQLTDIRNDMMKKLHLSKSQADRIMATLFKDWNPKAVVDPKMSAAQKAVADKMAAIRREAAKNIAMGKVNDAPLMRQLDAIIAKLGGLNTAAGAAAGRLQTLLATGSTYLASHLVAGSGAKGALAVGPKTGYPFTLHGTELILPTDNPQAASSLLAQHWSKLGIGSAGGYSSSAGTTSGGSYGPAPNINIDLRGAQIYGVDDLHGIIGEAIDAALTQSPTSGREPARMYGRPR
jgi:hypothetical protein